MASRVRRSPGSAIRAMLLLVVLSTLFAGCGSAPGGGRPPGNVFRLPSRTDMQSLDPAIAYDVTAWPLVRLMYQGLLDYGEGSDLVPWLAESLPTRSPDGRAYTFRIRRGIRFASGRDVRASDFAYTLERILDPKSKSPGEGFFRGIEGARAFQKAREREAEEKLPRRSLEPKHVSGLRAPDDHTFEIHLVEPDESFLKVMSLPFSYVVEPEAAERWGEELSRHPAGCGPFVLTEWRRGLRIRFDRNPNYSQPDRPKLDGVEVLIGIDDLVAQMMFERGELDLITEIAPPDLVRLRNHPRWKQCILSEPAASTQYLSMNTEAPPFNDVRVRRAVNHALDRERLLRVINGRGAVATTILPPTMAEYRPRNDYPHDEARAKALLAEAGFPNGFKVALWVIVDRAEHVKMAEAIQQDLGKVGIQVELKTLAFAVWDSAVSKRKNVPFAFAGWYQDYPDPSNFMDVLLRGDRIVAQNSNNYAFYSNPQVDAVLRQALKEPVAAKRSRLYQDAEDLVMADAPWAPLFHPTTYMLVREWVRGFKLHSVWHGRFERVSLEGSR